MIPLMLLMVISMIIMNGDYESLGEFCHFTFGNQKE